MSEKTIMDAVAGAEKFLPTPINDPTTAPEKVADKGKRGTVHQPQSTPPESEEAAALGQLQAVKIDLPTLANKSVLPPAFVIPEWLPEGCVTMLAAHGEGGKSQIGLYIAICIAAGLPIFGHPAQPQRRALFYSCEDPKPVLEWRIQQYCAALGLAPDLLAGWLFVMDAGELPSPELFVEQHGTPGMVTSSFRALRQLMKHEKIDVAVIDNASDVFACNENSRPAVRAFIRALNRLLPARQIGAVLLLAHVSKNASAMGTSGQQYSGSTAWHNSVRSRWELTRGTADGDSDSDESEPSAPYILKRAKSNYAAAGGAGLKFHWNHLHNVILPDVKPGPVIQAIEQRGAMKPILRAMIEADRTGTRISSNISARNNAAKVLPRFAPDLPKRLQDMDRLMPVLRQLERDGFICIKDYKGSNRTTYQCWAPTEKGRDEARP